MVRVSRAVIAIALTLAAARSHALTADSGDDVCPVDADPCIVTEPVEVTPESILDFGNRAVEVSGNGRFDFGAGSARIRSGAFTTSTTGDAIVAAGRDEAGVMRSGTVTIEARRLCSDGDSQAGCTRNIDCQLGNCDARRCNARPSLICTSDASCAGTCTGQRCSNNLTTRCTSNGDCDFGACAEQLTCRFGAEARSCSANADCNLGTCSVGEAPIVMGGEIDGRSEFPARVVLRAADAVSIGGNVDLAGTAHESNGGELDVSSGFGGITMSGPVRATSGGLGTGGNVNLESELDIVVSGPVDVSGGAYDGGFFDAMSDEGDLILLADVDLTAKGGAGYGGSMTFDAGRDLIFGNGTDPVRIRANGHTDHVDGGDAGYFELSALRDVYVNRGVKIVARGAGLFAFGGFLSISGDRDLWFDGRFDARAPLAEGTGGYHQLHVLGDIVIGENARFDLRGHYGSIFELYSEYGDATFAGRVRTDGEFDGENGILEIWACRLTISGRMSNGVHGGVTLLDAAETLHVTPEAALLARHGDVDLEYGDVNSPPVLEGKIRSENLSIKHGYDAGCPVCGDGTVDDYIEECDDGNAADGDGCSSRCRVE